MSRAASATRLILRDQKASLGFNNTNTSVAYTGAPVTGFDSASSFSAWVRLRSGSANLRQLIARWGDGSSNRAALCFQQAVALGSERYNIQAGYWNGSAYTLSGDVIVRPNVWFHVAATWDGTTMRAYLNGVLLGGTCASPASGVTTGLNLGNQSGANGFCLQSRAKLYTRVLSQADITNLAMLNDEAVSTSGLWVAWDLGDGAGNAIDTSGNGRNGTISNGVFSPGTPSKIRSQFDADLINNGDFEYAPQLTAATTAAAKWIDGTSGGSNTNNLFGWATVSGAVTASAAASFDSSEKYTGTYSIKLDLLNTSGAMAVANTLSTATPADASTLIPLLPSTSYTLTMRVKTLNAASNSVFAFIREFNGSLSSTLATTNTSKLSGTNDWTLVTLTFTTNASTKLGVIALLNNVAGNISTAWFDAVKLVQTTPAVRSQAAVRSASA